MGRGKFRFNVGRLLRSTAMIALAAGIFAPLSKQGSLAQTPNQSTFPSPEAASQALFKAVSSENDQDVMRILGGGKELLSSDDAEMDKHDREQFAQKFKEMHRLARQSDGTDLLYIGAENWPFPVPLASRAGKWYFDSEKGLLEIRFRRIGENEATAIETCRALIRTARANSTASQSDDPVLQYARNFVGSQKADHSGNVEDSSHVKTPFYGYYFRMIVGSNQGKTANGATQREAVFLAYPAEYRSSGVMTFATGPNGAVYESDLGPDTVKIAEQMTEWVRTSNWKTAN
jgi:Protein of unknown function (DUF2950)